MKTLLLLPLLALLLQAGQSVAPPPDGSPVAVLGFKWFRDRQAAPPLEPDNKTPARAVIPANKILQRNARSNDPVGVRDPNEDTIDGRSAAIDKSVEESRTPKTKPVDGFAYRVRVQNAGAKVVEIVFWEYESVDPANTASAVRRQFLCGVQIKPGKEKELQAFSSLGPTDVVNAGSATDKPASALQEQVLINRVEFTDGSIWQRPGWNFAEIRQSYTRALATPWAPTEMCRKL
jgi:hypothetical protein